ncbi:MAG: anhydro-N-acetylmuramic acid kinase [Candidatus Dadabacteria bacterium]|nr:MAG: anhydro-N-acetylmuramic acid kinase [Candidatus Dadabacteria bacterium]
MSSLTVAGVMTGTSADGIDVAVCRCDGSELDLRLQILHRESAPLPQRVASLVRKAPQGLTGTEYAELEYALSDAIAQTLLRIKQREQFDLAAVHGQTIWHHPPPERTPSTHQVLDPHRVALTLRVPVVWDFRRADVAAGGQGAPLAPVGHWLLFRQPDRHIAVVNVGGIANLTDLPAGAGLEAVRAWDTGPGMMVSDALAQRLLGRPFDHNGEVAASGHTIEAVATGLLADPWFARQPPRSAGREQFGAAFVERLTGHPAARNAAPQDLLRTALAITARAIAGCVNDLDIDELILCGGGTRNRALVQELGTLMPDTLVVPSDRHRIPADAVESVCFAALGALRANDVFLDLRAVTGASIPLRYGQICVPTGV